MRTILINPAPHGHGPYIVALWYGKELLEQLGEEDDTRFLVPHLYKKRLPSGKTLQEEVLAIGQFCDFPEIFDNILLDDKLGDLLNDLTFKGDNYGLRLELILEKQEEVEEKVKRYLEGRIQTKSLSGEQVTINGRDIFLEIGHNPIVKTEINKKYMTTIVPFSKLIEESVKAVERGKLKLDYEIKNPKKLIEIGRKIEEDQDLILTSTPSTLTYLRLENLVNEILVPPFKHPMKDDTKIERSAGYLVKSGIGGKILAEISKIETYLENIGYDIYSFDSKDESKRAIPKLIANQKTEFVIARLGLGTLYEALVCGKPFVTFPFQSWDDFEMWHNQKTFVEQKGVAVIYNQDFFRKLDEIKKNMANCNKEILDQFGTLDGIVYGTERIVKDLRSEGELK